MASLSRHHRRRKVAELTALLIQSEAIRIGPQIDQLAHSLQVATLARGAGAPADLVFGALMHDVGRMVAPHAHGRASADLIAPLVSAQTYWVVRVHDEIRLLDLAGPDGPAPRAAAHAREPWYPLACQFARDWDRYAFAPDARPLPLLFFLPMMEDLCTR